MPGTARSGAGEHGWQRAGYFVCGWFAFTYSAGLFTPLPLPPLSSGLTAPGTDGINNAGTVVGSAWNAADLANGSPNPGVSAFICSGGSYSFYNQPGFAQTWFRAIGPTGLVTGYSTAASCTDVSCFAGFLFSPATNAYTSISVSGAGTLAQGINTTGQIVGSVYGQPGAARFNQGFLRDPATGVITPFTVNGYGTWARGINDTGVITGFINQSGQTVGFVGTSAGYQVMAPSTLNVGGVALGVSQFLLPEGINNLGQVVGLWTDAAGNTHGFVGTPVSLPTGTTSNGSYLFNVNVIANTPIFIDPTVAVGYDYAIGAGDPLFESVMFPVGIGDSLYDLVVNGQSFNVAGGQVFDFLTHGFAGGVSAFEVLGIEPSAMLDPTNPQAFVTELSFVGSGIFTGTMTPITANVPEPGTLALLGLGLAGLAASRRRKQH